MARNRNPAQIIQLVMQLRKRGYSFIAILAIVAVSLFSSFDILRYLPGIGGNTTSTSSERSTKTPRGQAVEDVCEVLKVYDGDTMTLQCPGYSEKTRVRMFCIDTPEMAQKPWGEASRDYLRKITPPRVRVVQHQKDRYGRTVGEVFAGDVNLNLEQVRAGKAAVYNAYCDSVLYEQAQTEARQARRGIWAEPGMQQTPWDYRKQKREKSGT